MGGIKAVTPTSQGFAQVFDTSGVVEDVIRMQKDEEQRTKELNKTRLAYDPKGLYAKDIPAYQELMSEYQQYIADNHNSLLNSGENMEVWQKKQAYENEIKNFVAGSTGYNQMYYTALQKSLDDPKYQNPENKEFMEIAGRGTTVKDFRDGESWGNVVSDLKRNNNINFETIADSVFKAISTQEEIPGEQSTGIGGRVFYPVEGKITYDDEKLDAYLGSIMNNNASEVGRDIKDEYKGDLQAFKEAILPTLIQRETKRMQDYSQGKTDGDGTAPLGFHDSDIAVGSTTSINEPQQVYDPVSDKMVSLSPDEGGVKQRKLATVNRTTNEDGSSTTKSGGGQVLQFSGAGLAFEGALSNAHNLTTGEPISEAEAQVYKSNKVLEVGNYWKATNDLPIKLKSGNSITISAGAPLPDLDEMLENGEITEQERNRIMRKGAGDLIQAFEGVVLESKPDEVSLMQRAANAKWTEEKMKSEGGAIYTIVPLDEYKAQINSAIGTKRPKLADAAMANGMTSLDFLMETKNIKLDNTYMNFFGNKEAQTKSTLR